MPPLEHSSPVAVACDADATARQRVVRVLTSRGFTVVESSYGVEALLAAEVHQPQLVVFDLESAGVLGLYAIAAIRRAAPCVVIAFVPFESLGQGARQHGAAVALAADDLIGLAAALQELPSMERSEVVRPTGEVSP